MPAIIVRGENQRRVREREQLARYRIVLSARVAAREIGATGTVDEQYVAGEDAILCEHADRIRRVAGRMQDAEFLVAYFQRLTIFDVDSDVRRRRKQMHRDRRISQRAQLHRAATMIGVRVRIDDQIESQSVIREDREVALDLVADWIDDGRLANCFREREVSLTLAVIEFTKDHFDPCRIAKVIYLKTKDNVNIVAGLCLGFPTESYVAYTRKILLRFSQRARLRGSFAAVAFAPLQSYRGGVRGLLSMVHQGAIFAERVVVG